MAGNVAELGKKLADILDKLLATGDWDASLFLRSSSKRLRQLRDEAMQIAMGPDSHEEVAVSSYKQAPPEGAVQVYVSVYQANYKNLQDWQNTLKALVGHNVSRPIYFEELNVQQLIRSKADIEKHGYAVVNIKETDIYDLGRVVLDNFGNQLITLKEGAIKLENIVGFVRGNREIYRFQDASLVYEGEVS